MNTKERRMRLLAQCLLIFNFVASMSACGRSSETWKEEVLLHDGQKIIVERSQRYHGLSEPGQDAPIGEHTIRFKLPGNPQTISWVSEYGKDLGRTNFNLLALHVLHGTPYLVAEPNLCLSYNKWGRPNPPYVLFKHDGKTWQRIPMTELPVEFKTINLIVNNGREEDIEKAASKTGYVSAEDVRRLNSSLRQPEYQAILRETLPKERIKEMCESMVYYKCAWFGTGTDGKLNKEFADLWCKK